MARPKTATNILEAKGAFKAHPERKPKDEPIVSNPFPKKSPIHLTEEEKVCWDELVSIAPAGVLTGADTIVVEMAACLLSEYREDRAKFNPSKLTRLSSEINRIGLSPSSRASLTVEKPQEDF